METRAEMNYTYDMILQKYPGYQYILQSQVGTKVYDFTANNDSEAMRIAQAFMSSWSSVRITLKGEDGQHKEGN